MIIQQTDFSNGLNLLTADTSLGDSEYRWLINARNRFGYVEPIKQHVQITDIPAGNLQGTIGIGAVLIIFVDGKAYYREDGQTNWNLILGFQMDPNVSQYYTCAVPASSKDFVRKLSANGNIAAPITLTNDFKIDGSNAGVVVQDTINQPWFIEFDPVNQIYIARELGDYNHWGNVLLDAADREYVPIGTLMMYMSGILFIVSRDGSQVYHSITGRPLDFMIAVDVNGDKLPTESDGGAQRLSYAFDFDIITCIQALNIPDSFLIGTAHNIRIVTLDYTRTVFGEPLYTIAPVLKAGIVNQFSFCDVLGDFTVIDFDGLKSLNAVQNLKFRGRNSIFSLDVAKLFRIDSTTVVKQQQPCCIVFDDYAIFNVDTRYGNLMAVYDVLLKKWTSFDITLVHHIKQYTTVETLTQTKLYCVTQDNKLWQLFAGPGTEVAMLRTKAYVRRDAFALNEGQYEHKGEQLTTLFNGGTFSGHVTLIEYTDEQEAVANMFNRQTMPLNVILPGVMYPVRPPVIPNTQQQVDSPTFALREGLTGKKLSYIIMWDNDSQLVEYELITSEIGSKITQRQKQETIDGTISN